MPIAPDDLPRSPTGRVPQWVVDERTGRAIAPQGWLPPDVDETPPPAPRRRVRWQLPTVLVLAALIATWALTGGGAGVPDALASVPWLTGAASSEPSTPPTAEVVALADAAYLSAEGRDLFFGTTPQVLDAATFGDRCTDSPAAIGVPAGAAVGCYLPSEHSIVLYRPADARLQGYVVETAAHETLHAAWELLGDDEQGQLNTLLEAEVATLATDDPIHEQIAGSVGTHPENRPTELFAYVGTQVWRDGGLAPALETVYARFVNDRAALVAVHTGWQGMLDQLVADIDTASQALADQEYANASTRAQLEADTDGVAAYRSAYADKLAEVDALPAEQRSGLQLSWVWWDGTDLPMRPADETLAAAAALLARDDADLAARTAAVDAADGAAAAERARVEGLVADVNALQAQLDPTTG
ncbi:hypothetical protein [Cellulomonas soli]|uniref:hypothetical protein n=1 Tax=Cellulomonas soli TaxID=931535 RepID=UPI0015CD8E99|nr:hypothetical protein [Cellulomonas soli]NYI58222.1 hypothetical protein [Cellulomonas soli]